MRLVLIDWLIVAAYFVFVIGVGVVLRRRGSADSAAFFLSGRSLPWWLAGTSMVATTFAADTPLVVTSMVRRVGIHENWFWWSSALSAGLWAFFYARYWRRAGITTDAEFLVLRYAGRPARALRAFKVCYAALLINGIVMGWVISAMAKFTQAALGLPPDVVIPALILLAVAYGALAGLWGVVVTDFVQFGIAMLGAIVLAVLSVQHFGGLAELRAAALASEAAPATVLHVFPSFSGAADGVMLTFGIYLGVQWWAHRNADGGEYIGQRMMACRTERDARLATVWFAVAHNALRPWPWIIVALASLAIFPVLDDHEMAYPKMVIEFMPDGWRGLMIAAFLAAFMSTVDTHLNWGASYLVNDLAQGLLDLQLTARGERWAARASLLLMAVFAWVAANQISSVEKAWRFLLAIGAGAGPVALLRWYWWRINAWSELSAMATSLLAAVWIYQFGPEGILSLRGLPIALCACVAAVVWVPVTLLTPPVHETQLRVFAERVRPPGPGWRRFAYARDAVLSAQAVGWISTALLVFGLLFGLGAPVLGWGAAQTGLCAAAVLAGIGGLTYGTLDRRGRRSATNPAADEPLA